MAAAKKTSVKKSTVKKSAAKSTAKKSAAKSTTTSAKKTPGVKRKYSPATSAKVGEVMDELKAGTLRSGRSGKKVTDRKQAIAIGLSEARAEGKKVPDNPNRKK